MTVLKPSQKAYYTKVMKQMFPLKTRKKIQDKRTFYDFTDSQISKAHEYITKKKKDTLKKKDIWTRIQIIKYLNKKKIQHNFDIHTIPKKLLYQLLNDPSFLKFKKRQGYKILFMKLKKRKPEGDELDNFINLLKQERKKPRKKSSKPKNKRYYKKSK
jgi:hypothetical protein